jgi:hypothetical protein
MSRDKRERGSGSSAPVCSAVPEVHLLSEDLIRKCLADEKTINKAKRYGKKIVVDNREAKLTAYQWKGIIYVVEIVLYR